MTKLQSNLFSRLRVNFIRGYIDNIFYINSIAIVINLNYDYFKFHKLLIIIMTNSEICLVKHNFINLRMYFTMRITLSYREYIKNILSQWVLITDITTGKSIYKILSLWKWIWLW